MTEHEDIGRRLRSARETLNLSQQDVTDATGIARTAISDIERGMRKVSAVEARQMAVLYRCDVAWVVGDERTSPADAVLQRVVADLGPDGQRMVLRFAQFLAAGGA